MVEQKDRLLVIREKETPIWLTHSSQNSGTYSQMQSYLYTLSFAVEKMNQKSEGNLSRLKKSKYIRVQDKVTLLKRSYSNYTFQS